MKKIFKSKEELIPALDAFQDELEVLCEKHGINMLVGGVAINIACKDHRTHAYGISIAAGHPDDRESADAIAMDVVEPMLSHYVAFRATADAETQLETALAKLKD